MRGILVSDAFGSVATMGAFVECDRSDRTVLVTATRQDGSTTGARLLIVDTIESLSC